MCDQIPDEMLLEGRRVAIEPLSIIENESITYPGNALTSTAHARGYVGYWALIDKKLYLVETKGCCRVCAEGLVFADWVTGTIRPAASRLAAPPRPQTMPFPFTANTSFSSKPYQKGQGTPKQTSNDVKTVYLMRSRRKGLSIVK